jgi:2-phosphoglycerate kinase
LEEFFLRKVLNRNLHPTACRKSFKAYIKMKENTAKRT